jgi:hypothetical protein
MDLDDLRVLSGALLKEQKDFYKNDVLPQFEQIVDKLKKDNEEYQEKAEFGYVWHLPFRIGKKKRPLAIIPLMGIITWMAFFMAALALLILFNKF